MNIYTKIILRSDWQNKDGSKSVCLRLTINRKVKVISLKVKVLPKNWNARNNLVLKRDPEFLQKNKRIIKLHNKAKFIIEEYFLYDKNLTFFEFEQQFFNKTYGTDSFFEFVENELEISQTTLAKATLKGYKSQLSKLKGYRKHLSFTEIDFAFIRSYETKMLEINNRNTVNKALTFIKAFLNKAIAQNVYNGDNPFNTYPISREQGKRDYLTIDEVEKLKNLLYSGKLKSNHENVLRYFLFCCYTGLRYKDIAKFKFENIKRDNFTDENGIKKQINIIEIMMHKTKKMVKVPIIPEAEKLIVYPDIKLAKMPVFNVLTSQPTNRYLKEIAKTLKINKALSFHVSRHTLATNSLEYGIPIEVVSQILGHKDLRTTQIYAKVSNKLKISEMMKMEG